MIVISHGPLANRCGRRWGLPIGGRWRRKAAKLAHKETPKKQLSLAVVYLFIYFRNICRIDVQIIKTFMRLSSGLSSNVFLFFPFYYHRHHFHSFAAVRCHCWLFVWSLRLFLGATRTTGGDSKVQKERQKVFTTPREGGGGIQFQQSTGAVVAAVQGDAVSVGESSWRFRFKETEPKETSGTDYCDRRPYAAPINLGFKF